MSVGGVCRRGAAAAVLGLVALTACSGGAGGAGGSVRAVIRTAQPAQPARSHLDEQRSAAASRCPQRLPSTPPLVGAARLDMVLVPIAAIRVDACTYQAGALAGHVTFLDGVLADKIENAANTLQGQDPGSANLCAPGDVQPYLVRFDDGIHATSVRGAAAGCTDVTNGFLTAAPTAPWRAALVPLLTGAATCARRYGPTSGCVASGAW